MDAIEKNQLNERTRLRNASLWIELDWGGIMTPISAQQAIMDSLGQPSIESLMAITDENWGIKEAQRDRTSELDQAEIANQTKIAEDQVTTGRAKLAIQRTADAYLFAARVYDAKVKSLLMGAREYAAQVELEQLDVEQSRTILAIAKESLHQTQVNAQIYYEYIQKAMVEADIAKSQVEVAKANVRAIMADIAAGEADIRLITAQIEQYTAQADKAALQADVAMIFAEILTKKLSAVKLDLGRQEITAGFGYIQSRLDDALKKLETQELEELVRIEYANNALDEANALLPLEKAEEDLREVAQRYDLAVVTATVEKTRTVLETEVGLKRGLLATKESLDAQQLIVSTGKDDKQTWAQALVNDAHKYVYKHRLESQEVVASSIETISG